MRKVLFLAYHFPPVGGGGVQRSAKFVRYLRDVGYQCVVVTGTNTPRGHWTPEDETLAHEIPSGTEVHRVPGPEPLPSEGSRAKIERRLMLLSPFERWWLRGVEVLGRKHARDSEVVYASLIPYRTADPAVRLARSFGKPLVVDLQDPWALDEMWLYPTEIHRMIDLRRMRLRLGAADAVVMNTPEAVTRVWRHIPALLDRPVVSIPNGFDPGDFSDPPPARQDGKFRIVHTGYLHTEDGLRLRRVAPLRRLLGGMYEHVDMLTRSHVFLLKAIDALIADDPTLMSTIEVHLAGVLTETDRRIAAQSPVVHMPGYLSHAETVRLMQSADLLFLPMHDLPPGKRAGLVPGKTYEYLAAGRPILAAVPDGDARDLLAEAGNALLCRPADTKAMGELIAAQLERWRAGAPAPKPRAEVIERYERERQAKALAELFDLVLVGDGRR